MKLNKDEALKYEILKDFRINSKEKLAKHLVSDIVSESFFKIGK